MSEALSDEELATYRANEEKWPSKTKQVTRLLATIAARDAELERLNTAMLSGKSNWPFTAAKLEECLSTFPAGRSFLAQWTGADNRAKAAEAEVVELKARMEALQKCRHCGHKGNATMCNACGRCA